MAARRTTRGKGERAMPAARRKKALGRGKTSPTARSQSPAPKPRRAPALARLVTRLRRIIRAAAPDAIEVVKWGMPVYTQDGLICYIKAWPTYVTLGFFDPGSPLADPDGLLEGRGKTMRHVKLHSEAEVRPDLFADWVRQAVERNTRMK